MDQIKRAPIPFGLKFIFVCYLISIVWCLQTIFSMTAPQTAWTVANGILSCLVMVFILFGIWQRHAWTWKLGLVYNGYGLLMVPYAFLNFDKYVEQSISAATLQNGNTTAFMNKFVPGVLAFSFIVGGIYVVISAIIFYRNRRFFDPNA